MSRAIAHAGAVILGSALHAPVQAAGIPTFDAGSVMQEVKALMAGRASAVRTNCETSPGATVIVGGAPVVLDPRTCSEAQEIGAGR